jgi:pimeloyl-ACP methyl ester carboxylesterase
VSAYASVNGLDLYYEVHGEGRALVLLHGALGTIESCFADLLPSLAYSRRVIAVELQGHGHTGDIDRAFTFRDMAQDIAGLLRALSIERVDVFGYSLGGGVALELAIRHPGVVGRLAYVGGACYDPSGVYPELLEGSDSQDHDELDDPRWRQAYERVAPNPEAWPRLVEKMAEMDRSFIGWSADELKSLNAMLIVARFIQSAGGAMTSAVILGMIVTMFPRPGEQARAIGVFGFVASAGGSIVLLAGGALTQTINWHWIFFVNLPIGIATALIAPKVLDRDKGIGLERGVDWLGAILIVSALMLGVYSIIEAGTQGQGATQTLGLGVLATALLVAFVVHQARTPHPLMPLRIFRSRVVSSANLIQALMFAEMFGMFFPGGPLSPGGAGLRRLGGGSRVPSRRSGDRCTVGRLLGAPRHAVRCTRNGPSGPRIDSARTLVLHAGAGGRGLREQHPAWDAAPRGRRRSIDPVADDARDVGGRTERLRPRLRTGQHDAAGRWRTGAGRDRDPFDDPDRGPTGRWRFDRVRVDGGYHLGFGIGAGFVAVAVVAAAILLRPNGDVFAEEGRVEVGSAELKPAYVGEVSGSSNV